jgi:hypothetical protein
MTILMEFQGQRHLIIIDLLGRYHTLKAAEIEAPEEYDDFQDLQNHIKAQKNLLTREAFKGMRKEHFEIQETKLIDKQRRGGDMP